MTSTIDLNWDRKEATAEMMRLASVGSTREEYASVLASIVTEVADPLRRVEVMLRDQLKVDDPQLQALLDHVVTLGGKRLRPILVLLAAKACGPITQDTIRLAAAVELVHTATLIHDDILDAADTRRHRQTLHTAFNPQSSLLVGDWLFTQAYYLCNQSGSTLPGRWLAQAAKEVCEGEIRQSMASGDRHLSVDEYLDILGKKTGSLCAVACSLGAWSAEADETTSHSFHEFGWKLGQAFQIHDDYLDYWGDPAKLGKPVGQDFAAGKATLPLLRLFQVLDETRLEHFSKAFDSRTEEAFRETLDELNRRHIDRFTCDLAVALSHEAAHLLHGNQRKIHADRSPIHSLVRLAAAAVQRAA
jgi:octaprenyl-diphosphate synthase